MADDEAIVEFHDITKRFPGTQALDAVSFSVRRGEVHALVGANGAGKSTLMNILGGQFRADEGQIVLEGTPVTFANPYQAIQAGVSIVYQELKLCDNLTAAQNIFLGSEIVSRSGRLDWRTMKRRSREVLASIEAGVEPDDSMRDLSVGKRQMVEIARALNQKSKIVVLDEPTSALSYHDAEHLFSQLDALREAGITVIFISHRIDEVFRISDRITVLRDGRYQGTFATPETTREHVVSLIAGKDLSAELAGHSGEVARGDVVLSVRDLARGRYFSDVAFELHSGELLGIYGLQGAGRTEILECLFGLARPDNGTIAINGRETVFRSTAAAIDSGLALVPEDRRGVGIFPNLSVQDNLNSAVPEGIVRGGFLRNSAMAALTTRYRDAFSIKMAGLRQPIINLSGGNQQKVIIAKWLSKEPRILLLDEVTKGIDVGAKAEIYRLIRELKKQGLAILMVSSEIDEVMAECDRTLVMWSGRIVGEMTQQEMTRQRLLAMAMGVESDTPVLQQEVPQDE